jgi:hypothetical protein
MRSALRPGLVLCCALIGLAFDHTALAQTGDVNADTVRAGRFDSGKMWTFEYAPKKYFTETYGFDANDQWFERARLAALRIPGCSASFISPNGLIVTNHHCARSRVVQVSRAGENLLENGFYAPSLDDERPVANYHADQLIAVSDVSDEVLAAVDRVTTETERRSARTAVIQQIQARLREQHRGQADSLFVEVVSLYAGGRYSAYVFRRYTDVRLVAAAELQLGFFGGDADNFTYPRYALDFAFLRVYGRDGKPLKSPNYFTWSKSGVREKDAVFVIGNPGPTTRMNAVAQLEFIRDVQLPAQIAVLQSRWNALNAAYQADRSAPDAAAIRNAMFGLSNTLKATGGRITALNDAVIMGRRRDAEKKFRDAVEADPKLKAAYGNVLTRLADVQQRKRRFATQYGVTLNYGTAGATPAVLRRALLTADLIQALRANAPADTIAAIRRRILAIPSNVAPIERALLAAQYEQWSMFLPAQDSVLRIALGGRSQAEAVTTLLASSVFADSARAATAIQGNQITLDDPALRVVTGFGAVYSPFAAEWQQLLAEEAELNAQLGRARYEIYGTEIAPDATSSPRITDGVVSRYEFNGTIAPPYTTFYGLYERYSAFGPGTEWDLPKRWVPQPRELDLETPLNFVSTADTYGGNSGSPAVTRNLELVGLNFDRNVNGLSRDYVYLPERGRNIMVDVRAIAESLDAVYDAHRILLEVTNGRLYNTEAAADAARKK